jgi:hypothetical protein
VRKRRPGRGPADSPSGPRALGPGAERRSTPPSSGYSSWVCLRSCSY